MKESDRRLFEDHKQLAMRIALFYRKRLPPWIPLEDLVSSAMAGLWDAVRLHSMGDESFRLYAIMRIKGAIVDDLRTQDWLPRRYRSLVGQGKRHPASRVALEELGLELRSTAEEVDSEVQRRMVAPRLMRALDVLNERERTIVMSHYFRGDRMKDIGARMGITEARVSQIHKVAMGKLREVLPKDSIP
jgi:RNA polymerase sigma factor for flagellar operon FliA